MQSSLLLLLSALVLLTSSCAKKKCDEPLPAPANANDVLFLQVDYLTNAFEGGKEFSFPTPTPTFTITNQYDQPGDFGGVKLTYAELNEPLFDGTIIWLGCGQMNFPQNLLPASRFDTVATRGVVMPSAGFENVFNPGNQSLDYITPWRSAQRLVKVRQYLAANPGTTVKLFLYTPSVGVGNPADWNWILFLKK